MHIQDRELSYWATASDEEHLQGLLHPPGFASEQWVNYLNQERRAVVDIYLGVLHTRSKYLPLAIRSKYNLNQRVQG